MTRQAKAFKEAMFRRCLWCKLKHRCGKADTENCRARVREQLKQGELI